MKRIAALALVLAMARLRDPAVYVAGGPGLGGRLGRISHHPGGRIQGLRKPDDSPGCPAEPGRSVIPHTVHE